MKVLSPFGPKIAVIKIPSNLVKKINDEVESIIKDKKNDDIRSPVVTPSVLAICLDTKISLLVLAPITGNRPTVR